MMNQFNCTGRLTSDPKVYERDGIHRTTFSLAVDRDGVKDEEKTSVDFFDFVAWRNTADYIAKFYKKGDLVGIVNARASTREYVDASGNKHRKQEFQVDKIYLLARSRKSEVSEVSEEENIA